LNLLKIENPSIPLWPAINILLLILIIINFLIHAVSFFI